MARFQHHGFRQSHSFARAGGVVRRTLEDITKLDSKVRRSDPLLDLPSPLSLLEGCRKVGDLKRVHFFMLCNGLDTSSSLGSHLIRLFASNSNLIDANYVFNKVVEPCVYAWTAVISANAKIGQGVIAFELYQKVCLSSNVMNRFVFYAMLKACTMSLTLLHLRLIHNDIITDGLEIDLFIGSILVDMYSKCGSLEEARQSFSKLCNRDVVSWGAMIVGYVQHNKPVAALQTFERMKQEGTEPNKIIFPSVLKACATTGDMEQGRLIHNQILESGGILDVAVGSALVDMYLKCNSLQEARKLFDKLPVRNVVSWGAIIFAYAQHGEAFLALELFQQMQQKGIKPDKVIFLSALKACGILGAIQYGRVVHEQSIATGDVSDIVVGTIIVEMYFRCGCLLSACNMFVKLPIRNVVSWCAMISGYIEHGKSEEAIELFQIMQQEGVKPDKAIFLSMLNMCTSTEALEEGRLMHQQIINSTLILDAVIGSTIVHLYTKCGSLKEAQAVFNKLTDRNVVSWCSIIAGYVQCGQSLFALELFEQMEQEGMEPDEFIFSSVLKACGNVKGKIHGRLIHSQVIESGAISDFVVGNALVDMYMKCGCFYEACEVFEKLPSRSVVSWGAMIAGYAQQEEWFAALELFRMMQMKNIEPDTVIFSSILKACGGIGAIKKGRRLHQDIVKREIELDTVLGSALVDMYVKCGSVKEACEVFEKLPNRNVVSWGAMVSGYAQDGNITMAGQYLVNMQKEGIKPDKMMFTRILAACSRAGLVDEGHHYFESLKADHDIEPDNYHDACMVNLVSLAGFLREAETRLLTRPHIIGQKTLLNACKVYGSLELGKHCFDRMTHSGNHTAPAYVLLSNMYAGAQRNGHLNDYKNVSSNGRNL